jgi:hypothetical protein
MGSKLTRILCRCLWWCRLRGLPHHHTTGTPRTGITPERGTWKKERMLSDVIKYTHTYIYTYKKGKIFLNGSMFQFQICMLYYKIYQKTKPKSDVTVLRIYMIKSHNRTWCIIFFFFLKCCTNVFIFSLFFSFIIHMCIQGLGFLFVCFLVFFFPFFGGNNTRDWAWPCTC